MRLQGVAYFDPYAPFGDPPVRDVLQGIPVVILLLVATLLEVSGDAVVRLAIYSHAGQARFLLFATGAAKSARRSSKAFLPCKRYQVRSCEMEMRSPPRKACNASGR